MIQCSQCEHFERGAAGQLGFRCDPFSTIKEPECLGKWQFLRLSELSQKVERMVAAYEATLALYKKMQPLQEKMFRHMEQEIQDAEEADSWKYNAEEEQEEGPKQGDENDEQGEQRSPYTPGE